MAETTTELDTTKEEQLGSNGHSEEAGLVDDFEFIRVISSQKPVEEVIEIPEWQGLKVLCRPLTAPDRLAIHALAYDKETQITDYKRAQFEVLLAGCFNPKTGHKAFREGHRKMLMERPEHGAAVERLYFTVMRISRMFVNQQESAKKN